MSIAVTKTALSDNEIIIYFKKYTNGRIPVSGRDQTRARPPHPTVMGSYCASFSFIRFFQVPKIVLREDYFLLRRFKFNKVC